jgi:hypothetical protein
MTEFFLIYGYIQNPDFFDYQAEQKYASYNDAFAADVQQQIDLAVSYFYIFFKFISSIITES